LQLDPVPRQYPHLLSMWITLVEVVLDAALGLTLWLTGHLVAGNYYQALGRNWGPSLRTDQILGAGALWLIGDLAGLPFVGAVPIVSVVALAWGAVLGSLHRLDRRTFFALLAVGLADVIAGCRAGSAAAPPVGTASPPPEPPGWDEPTPPTPGPAPTGPNRVL